MSKQSSEDRPPAYDSQIFLPSEIKHDNYYKNAMSISIIYLKTACLLFLFSGFMLWFSIYTTWQFLHITNNAMVKNQCYKYITNTQSWALAHLFEVRYPLPTQFFPMDR
jgi:hypothetical protein